nr:unnamed protein product [Digitaria exilis]
MSSSSVPHGRQAPVAFSRTHRFNDWLSREKLYITAEAPTTGRATGRREAREAREPLTVSVGRSSQAWFCPAHTTTVSMKGKGAYVLLP